MSQALPAHRVVARPVGLVVLVATFALVATALASVAFSLAAGGEAFSTTKALWVSVPIGLALGLGLMWWGKDVPAERAITRGHASLAVVSIWTLLGVLGALPLMIGAGTHPVDAFFEGVSGFTATGATIYGDIEGSLNEPLVLWRAVMHWVGGMGIVLLFVAVLPNVGVGGKNMFKAEMPAVQQGGLRPRVVETSKGIFRIYVSFTVVFIAVYSLLGMGFHDAIAHGLSTGATGGFSTRDASLGAFNSPALEWAASLFMLVGGVNFGLYYVFSRTRRLTVFRKSVEFRTYIWVVVAFTLILTVALRPLHPDVFTTLRYAFFRVATSLTSTGFGIDDHSRYPPLAMLIMVLMNLMGSCAGSTSGGIKVARIVILWKAAASQIRRSIQPAVVQVVRLDRGPVKPTVLLEVGAFLFLYLLSMIGLMAFVAGVDGVPLQTAFGAALGCLSNMGPMPFFIGEDNYSWLSGPSKVALTFGMILGRLEFFTVLALLFPEAWRR